MIAFALVLAAIALGGHALFRLAWIREARAGRIEAPIGPYEQVTTTAICGVALWIAINWVLAFTHLLRGPVIAACAVAVAAGGGFAAYRLQSASRAIPFPLVVLHEGKVARPFVILAAVAPLLVWIAYAAMRALSLPVLSPDGNAYHLPKALLLMWNSGYAAYDYPDFRATSYPFDYELLLADVMTIDGSDRSTAWIAIAFFALFLLSAAAHAERTATSALVPLAAILVVAVSPIVLLQSGVHKNDLMAATFAVMAFLFVARWIARGERIYGALAIVAVALMLGTKPPGAFVAVAVAPFWVLGLIRAMRKHPDRRVSEIGAHLTVAIASFCLLGGMVIVFNLIRSHHPYGVDAYLKDATGYGAFRNLWSFPLLLLARPFGSSTRDIWVPWRGERWWWMTYEMHTSHYGWLFTIVVLALVPLVVRELRRAPRGPDRTTRLVAVGVAVLAAAVTVPLRISPSPEGGFNAFPRYLVFVVPPVVAYVVPRVFAWVASRAKGAVLEPALTIALAVHFVVVACIVARHDMYQPLFFVLKAFESEERIRTPQQAGDRAAFIIAQVAGPRDKVLFDASFDSWTYPAYGEDWQRPVLLVSPGLDPIDIPDDVRWIAADHAYETAWGHPDFKTMGQLDRYLNRGTPSPQSMRIFHQLAKDKRFRLIYRSYPTNQAVWKRRAPGEDPAKDPPPTILMFQK